MIACPVAFWRKRRGGAVAKGQGKNVGGNKAGSNPVRAGKFGGNYEKQNRLV